MENINILNKKIEIFETVETIYKNSEDFEERFKGFLDFDLTHLSKIINVFFPSENSCTMTIYSPRNGLLSFICIQNVNNWDFIEGFIEKYRAREI